MIRCGLLPNQLGIFPTIDCLRPTDTAVGDNLDVPENGLSGDCASNVSSHIEQLRRYRSRRIRAKRSVPHSTRRTLNARAVPHHDGASARPSPPLPRCRHASPSGGLVGGLRARRLMIRNRQRPGSARCGSTARGGRAAARASGRWPRTLRAGRPGTSPASCARNPPGHHAR
jgi:hypothetical protein